MTNTGSSETGTATLAPRTGIPGPRLPQVNLLSPDTLQNLAVRQVKRRLVAAGLVGVVLVAGGWGVQSWRLSSAKSDLAAEQALTPPLQAQLTELEPVARFVSGLDSRKQAASKAMAAEVLFSEALVDMNKRLPKGVELSTMSVTITPAIVPTLVPPVSPLAKAGIDANGKDTTKAQQPAAAADGSATPAASTPSTAASAVQCARPDPFKPALIIGCVTLSGTASSREAVGKFVESLKSAKIYADPFIATTTVNGATGERSVAFNGSVGITGEIVSGRYADLSWLTDPAVLAAAEKMVAAGNTAGVRLDEKADALAEYQKAQAAAAAKAEAAAAKKAEKEAAEEAAKQQQALIDALNKANANKENNTGEGQ
ncbi:MAG: hypothetical protein ACT4QG_07835 [Sporichthyaceae bacterium]